MLPARSVFHQNDVTVVCSYAHANIFSPILQEADVRERVAAQLEALITASGWEMGGVCSDREAAAVPSRAADSFVEGLMLTTTTRAYGRYFRSEWSSKCTQWAAAFRGGAHVTTNNFLEGWHACLKRHFMRSSNRTAGRLVMK